MSEISTSSDSTVERLIIEIREQFLHERYTINPKNYDPIDIEKLKTNDYTIKRFVVYQDMNKQSALNQLDEAMKWRKSFGVNHIDYCDFGVEMFETGAWFICNDDKQSRPVVYVRAKTYTKNRQLENIVKKAVVFLINKLDEMADEKGFVIFTDNTDVGLQNIDLKISRFMIKLLKNYFPGSLKCVILYNLPPILNKMMSLFKRLLGSKYSNIYKVITNREEIFDYIDRDKVPKYLGGKFQIDFTKPPPNCTLSAADIAVKHSIDAEDMKKYVKLLEPHIQEAKLLVFRELC